MYFVPSTLIPLAQHASAGTDSIERARDSGPRALRQHLVVTALAAACTRLENDLQGQAGLAYECGKPHLQPSTESQVTPQLPNFRLSLGHSALNQSNVGVCACSRRAAQVDLAAA